MTTRQPFTASIAPEVMAAYAGQSARFNVALAEQMATVEAAARLRLPEGARIVARSNQWGDNYRAVIAVGTVKGVGVNGAGRLVVEMQRQGGYPATFYAEDVQVEAEYVAA